LALAGARDSFQGVAQDLASELSRIVAKEFIVDEAPLEAEEKMNTDKKANTAEEHWLQYGWCPPLRQRSG